LGSSENGNDVFFATAESLVPADTDGGYDVYDARVPRPEDNPPASAVPCEGSVCQGPPSLQSPLAAPASSTFSGVGNAAPEVVSPAPVSVKKTSPPVRACKRGYVKKKGKCVKKPKVKKAGHEGRAHR
jgi:hypothetical protein